jgi:hypothetical protein
MPIMSVFWVKCSKGELKKQNYGPNAGYRLGFVFRISLKVSIQGQIRNFISIMYF